MAGINFQEAGTMHFRWKHKIKAFLEGRTTLSEKEAVSHEDCQLGKWLYSEALIKHGTLSEVHQLEKDHVALHAAVKKIIKLKQAGDTAGIQEEFAKLEEYSKKVVSLLAYLNARIL